MNVAKKRTLPGDKDGPGLKRLAHTSKLVQGATTKKEMLTNRLGEVVWSGQLEFHDVDKQKRVVSSGSFFSRQKINTVNWPKQLKMTTILLEDYMKLIYYRSVMGTSQFVTFFMDKDCDKMSRRAFSQSTNGRNHGCALLEYTSSAIWLLLLRSCSLEDENVTVGWIDKYTYQDSAVELLTDLGILSHATIIDNFAKIARLAKKSETKSAKKIASLQDELQQKDKVMVEQQILHQVEMESKNKVVEKKSEQLASMEVEMEALMKEKDKDLRKLDTLKKEMKRREKMLEEQKELLSKERTKIMAESWRNQERIKKEVKVKQKQKNRQKTRMLKNQLNEMETRRSELKNKVQATLDHFEKEFMCTICQNTFTKAKTLNCGHSFCTKCIEEMLTHNEEAPCPNCLEPWETNVPSVVIDSCISRINESRLEDKARQTGDETETESEEEPIQSEQEVRSQSEESDEDPSPVSPSSCESSASSYCRAPSSIEDMFTSDSSSDSN